jgi:hypothetical protein
MVPPGTFPRPRRAYVCLLILDLSKETRGERNIAL